MREKFGGETHIYNGEGGVAEHMGFVVTSVTPILESGQS